MADIISVNIKPRLLVIFAILTNRLSIY